MRARRQNWTVARVSSRVATAIEHTSPAPVTALSDAIRAWAEDALADGAVSVPLIRPISVNNLFSNTKGRGRAKSKAYVAWLAEQKAVIMAAGPRKHVGGPVEVALCVPCGSRVDTDNVSKAYIDCLVSMNIIDDDRNVVTTAIVWTTPDAGQAVIVRAIGGEA